MIVAILHEIVTQFIHPLVSVNVYTLIPCYNTLPPSNHLK